MVPIATGGRILLTVLYRYRIYDTVPGQESAFTDFFLAYLLPVQLRHGARLVGRWLTDDGARVIAIWEYDSEESFNAIDQVVRADPDSLVAQQYRREALPTMFTAVEEGFMRSTVPPAMQAPESTT
jgi:hypothetical protein